MYNNLKAEMARHDMSAPDLARALGITEKTARNKLQGKTPFTVPEAIIIQRDLFPQCDILYLFTPYDKS